MVLESGCDAECQLAQNDCAREVPACTRGLRARIASADWSALLQSVALSTVILISLRLPPNVLSFGLISLRVATNVLSFCLISLRAVADCSACRRMPHPVTLCSVCCRRMLCMPLRLDSATCVFQHRARALNSLTASSN